MARRDMPADQGMYRRQFEHEACGIGMLAHIKGRKSHKIVNDAITVLERLKHRGGAGSEEDTGDGAGLMLQIPHAFFVATSTSEGVVLPHERDYGVAMVFASPEEDKCKNTLESFALCAQAQGVSVIWTRRVPTNKSAAGRAAAELCPSIYQVFLEKPEGKSSHEFEKILYQLSRSATDRIRYTTGDADPYFYLASCSSKTIVYKGMLLPEQLSAFYLDLLDERVKSSLVLVHSRFSTNTFPSWERAQPERVLIHNGEINTIRGNVNWAKSRARRFLHDSAGQANPLSFSAIDEDGSDSAMLDDYIRFLIYAGYSLPHAMAMTVPEPYENNEQLNEQKQAFLEFHNCLSEPWDGPAALAFTDGDVCGAVLDRNGLRPARYTITKDDLLVLSSETGVLDFTPHTIAASGRISPGEMLLVDTVKGALITNEDLKGALATQKPYTLWLKEGLKHLDDLSTSPKKHALQALVDLHEDTQQAEGSSATQSMEHLVHDVCNPNSKVSLTELQKEQIFGYTWEDLNLTLKGMAQTGEDPIGSMGTDIPLAVLSERPQVLYNYFKQLFAQVTNPPIDSLREKNVISSSTLLGSEKSLGEPSAASCELIKLASPILLPDQLEKLKQLEDDTFKTIVLPAVFKAKQGSLETTLEQLFASADRALAQGYTILILSDIYVDKELAPIPALLALSGLHQHLIRKGSRTSCSLVVEASDAWETHHVAALVSYGANAVCPSQAYEVLSRMCAERLLSCTPKEAHEKYAHAATKGIIKTMSKMGISTVRSYHGSQIFEALGISQSVIDRYFTGTASRIEGLTLELIEAEVLEKHAEACSATQETLLSGGNYRWRKDGEQHLYNPQTIYYLQQACKTGDYSLFKTFTQTIEEQNAQGQSIRSLLNIRLAEKPIPLGTVESEESILKRFKTGAMSYGSISAEAHECLAEAMNAVGGKSNTGEGGEDERRFLRTQNGADTCSAIKQVASARFGVTINYLNNAQEIQIKMAQGAKPGEGGHLPGGKVYPWIAQNRFATPGVELISPPPHHDIYSIEDLAQLIHDLKSANPQARISVKLVSEAGVGTIAVGVAKGLADVIVISGYDGGTGAAPRTSVRHAGLPWELGVAEAHQSLLLNGLRNRVTIETDGKLLTGRDIIIAALLGAEEFAFATSALVSMGCDMMRVCHRDTCPVGIATQNPRLRKNFSGKPEHVMHLMSFLAREVREWLSRIGATSLNEIVGRTELLSQVSERPTQKSASVDLSALMYQPMVNVTPEDRHFTQKQQHHLERYRDEAVLIPLCKLALEEQGPVEYTLPITNQDRAVGCRLSGEVAQRYGSKGLPEDTIKLYFTGSAGQSFGAFAAPGLSLYLTGEANDYLGKGLSGGKIIVTRPHELLGCKDTRVAIGNVSFFGATSGEGYIAGSAGERFCVRNSGARVVAEGVGDHGCEYMTGGVALILGDVGRNFAAGMSGGCAYLYNNKGNVASKCNLERAALTALEASDIETVLELLEKHATYTNSPLAYQLLDDFDNQINAFVKLMPHDYRIALGAMEEAKSQGFDENASLLAAYEAVCS